MRSKLINLFGGLAAVALVSPQSAAAAVTDFGPIEQRLTMDCAASRFWGIVVVRTGAGQTYQHVCGSADPAGTPISSNSRFKIFSTTKLLTAIAVMRLVERGKLHLDGSITTYIPQAPASWRNVTIRHLLQHTSGLPDQTERVLALYTTGYPAALKAVLAEDRAAGTRPATAPGSTWKYNNFGYDLLATAVANAAHKPFDRALRDIVFRPAGMSSATVERSRLVDGKPASEIDADLAQGYNGSVDKLEPAPSFEFVQLGAGSVHAKVADLIALDSALKSGKLLRPASLELMTSNLRSDKTPPPGRGYGMGMMVRGEAPLKYTGHDGGSNGFLSDFERYPDGTVLVVLSNLGFADIDWIRPAVGRAVAPR